MKYPLRRIYLPSFWKGDVLAASPATHFLLLGTSQDVTSSLIDRLPAVRFCDPALDWHSEIDRYTHKDLRRRQISKTKIKKIRTKRSSHWYQSLKPTWFVLVNWCENSQVFTSFQCPLLCCRIYSTLPTLLAHFYDSVQHTKENTSPFSYVISKTVSYYSVLCKTRLLCSLN